MAEALLDTADLDIEACARDLEGKSVLEILTWASEQIPRITFATGFGAEGCVITDVIGRHQLPIDLFTLDTGLLFPETHELWHRLEARYDITIRGVVPDQTVEQQGMSRGAALWRRDPDQCCRLRKVRPLERALEGFDAWISGIRRDQTASRAQAKVVEVDHKFGLIKINPLVTWTHDDVWAYLYAHDVPYNVLHESGYPSIGCQPCTSQIIPGEHLRAGRWRVTGKNECGLHLKDKA